jgi:hypothetical protein
VENFGTDTRFRKVSIEASQLFRAFRVGGFGESPVRFFRDVHDKGQ